MLYSLASRARDAYGRWQKIRQAATACFIMAGGPTTITSAFIHRAARRGLPRGFWCRHHPATKGGASSRPGPSGRHHETECLIVSKSTSPSPAASLGTGQNRHPPRRVPVPIHSLGISRILAYSLESSAFTPLKSHLAVGISRVFGVAIWTRGWRRAV